MLVSHRKKFIFFKTVKTGGTSVEVFFERFCMADGTWNFSHQRDTHMSPSGIIGRRSSNPRESSWYNHMSATQIKSQLDPGIWNDYLKFTVIRNPFDKMISAYYMFAPKVSKTTCRKVRIEKFREWLNSFQRDYILHRSEIENVNIPHYEIPIHLSVFDRDKYIIGDVGCVDQFIRFEHLVRDVTALCERLEINADIISLPRLKQGMRHTDIKCEEYYDTTTEAFVRELFKWEIDYFNYEMIRE